MADECRMRHIPLWSHCFGSAYNSVMAGADMIIHGMLLDDKTLDIMAEKGIKPLSDHQLPSCMVHHISAYI